MSFPRKLLNQGEEIVLDLKPHWIFLAPSGVALVLVVVAGAVIAAKTGGGSNLDTVVRILAALVVLVVLGWFVSRYARWSTTNFVLTGDRIISRHGLVSKQGIEIPLQRVNTVMFHQSVFERVVGAGDLTIESAGERGSESFSDIRRPAQVQQQIYVQMEESSNRDYRRMGDQIASAAPHAAPSPQLSTAEQLEKLDELRRRGVLSEEEFQQQKARLLG